MANELPYFRFTVQAWQNGKIGIETLELKGLFIDICGYYWIQDCSLTLALLEKKYKNELNLIKELINLGIIKHELRHDKVQIEFLNIQYDLLSEKRKHRQAAGSKGGKAKAKLQQKSTYKDKDKENNKDNNKDKDNIDSRKLKFADSLKPFLEKFGKEILNEFYFYWTEPNHSKTKLRFEQQKTWEVSRRLDRWAKNNKGFNKPKEKNSIEKKLDALEIVKKNIANEPTNDIRAISN